MEASGGLTAQEKNEEADLFGSGSDSSSSSSSDSDDGGGAAGAASASGSAAAAASASGSASASASASAAPTTEPAQAAAPAVSDEESGLPGQKVVLPRHARTDAESDEVLSAKLPNILNVKRECFDEVSFLEDGEQDDDAVSGASYLRWRFKKDASNNRVRDERNQYVPESNARIVEWSDGSLQLLIGGETFDIEKKMHTENVNAYVYAQQVAAVSKLDEQGQAVPETLLSCHSKIRGRLTFKPSSLTSSAHKEHVLKVRKKYTKKMRVKTFSTNSNPEQDKAEREKLLAERIRTQERQERRTGYSRGGGGGGKRMSESFLEEGQEPLERDVLEREDDSEEEGGQDGAGAAQAQGQTSLSSYQRSTRRQRAAAAADEEEEDDEDEDEDEEGGGGAPEQAAYVPPAGGALDDDDDSDDEDDGALASAPAKKRKRNVFDDDDSDSD